MKKVTLELTAAEAALLRNALGDYRGKNAGRAVNSEDERFRKYCRENADEAQELIYKINAAFKA